MICMNCGMELEANEYHPIAFCALVKAGLNPLSVVLEAIGPLRDNMPGASPSKPCGWQYDESGEYWETDCGEAFVLLDGTPADNGMRFCCYCGKRLAVEETLPFRDLAAAEGEGDA